MKSRNILLLSILSFSVILGACQREEKAVSSPPLVNPAVSPADEIIKSSEADTNQFGDLFKRVSFDYETNCLQLHDDTANTVLKEIKFEKNSFAPNIYKFRDGYAVWVLNADRPVEIISYGKGKSFKFPENIPHHFLCLYDASLNPVKEIPLDAVMPGDAALRAGGGIAASDDGSLILMTYSRQLYICDTSSGNVEKVFDETNNDVYFKQALFTGDNKHIVFIGSIKVEEGACAYGLIDVDAGEMTMHVEKKFFESHIVLSGNYACICDNENPDGFGGQPNGRVPILNLETKESFVMQVDGAESAFAKVTEDGKYLITQKNTDGDIRIRQYDLETRKVIKEKLFAYEDGIYRISRIIYSGNAALYYLVCITEDDIFLYPFDCEAS